TMPKPSWRRPSGQARSSHCYSSSMATTLASSTQRWTSQLAHDLSLQGEAMFFSWPSAATTGGYSHDEEVVQLSEPAFDRFLDDLGTTGATEIILIAHSMGNRLVTKVLSDRASRGKPTPNLRELLLAAPDINAEIFREQILPGLAMLQGTHRSIYAS